MTLANEILKRLIRIQQDIALSSMTYQELLHFICEEAQIITTAQGAVVEVLDENDMVYTAASGQFATNIGLRIPKDQSLSGLAVQRNKAIICEDTEKDPRVNFQACRRIGVRSMAIVPLSSAGKLAGVLKVASREPHTFSASTLEILTLMSGFLAAAMIRCETEEKVLSALRFTQEQTKYRDAISTLAPDVLYIFDIKTKKRVYSSKHVGNLLGFTHFDESIDESKFLNSRMYEEDFPRFVAHQRKFKNSKTDESHEVEFRALDVQGKWRWLRFRESVFGRDEDGSVVQTVGIASDVTHLKDQQELLKQKVMEQTRELQLLSENIPQMIWQTDAEGKE